MKKRFLCALMALCFILNTCGAMAAELQLPAALQKISAQAFEDCEGMTGLLTIPGSTRTVGAKALAGTSLFALEAEDGVGSIDAAALGESKLCYIMVHGKDTVIPTALADSACYLFAYSGSAPWENAAASSAECIDLTDLHMHEGFYYELSAGGARLLCAVDNSALPEEVTIPVSLEGRRVAQVAESAFYGCEEIRTLNLPEGIAVADGALGALTRTDVNYYKNDYSEAPASDFTYTISDGKVAINSYTGSADIVHIPAMIEGCPVVTIERYAFVASPVSEWLLPDSIEMIYFNAFAGAQLHSIRLPENDNLYIHNKCFMNTPNLTSIHLPEGLTGIGGYCFQDSGLTSIHIPPKIESLGYNTFEGCTNLTEVTFAEGSKLDYIYGAFKDTGVTKIILPESVTRIDPDSFVSWFKKDKFEIWMGSAVNNLPQLSISGNETFPDGAVIYAPAGSYAAEWADKYEHYTGYCCNKVYYGGGGCAEFFGGDHDYVFDSDNITLDTDSGLHMHNIIYKCTRCADTKSTDQAQGVNVCWRCDAKAAYGAGASIPAEKFEFLDRYKLDGNVYYRIRLLADQSGVNAGHEALFMDEQLQMVTKRDTINQLFKVHMYTGSGTLPWEYTETTSDYPSLEQRAELVSSSLSNARSSLSLAKTFIELDMCYEKLGSTAMAGLSLLWGNPEAALSSLKEAVVPDMDALVTVMHITLLNKLAESTEYDAQHYTNSLSTIVDSDGFIICENAEASLQAYANCLAMWQLSTDNSSGIIDEIAACDSAFGVGVRNIMTMLKGAAGVEDNIYAKTGVLVTQTMYSALTAADEGNAANTDLVIKYIGDLAAIAADIAKPSCLGTMVELYKSGTFSLSQFMYVDGAMDKYERSYNAFCLNNSTPLYQAHDALA